MWPSERPRAGSSKHVAAWAVRRWARHASRLFYHEKSALRAMTVVRPQIVSPYTCARCKHILDNIATSNAPRPASVVAAISHPLKSQCSVYNLL